MLEELCRTVFYNKCRQVEEESIQLVYIRGYGKRKPENEFKDFFKWDDSYHVWDGYLVRKAINAKVGDPIREAFNYFNRSDKMTDAYIRKKYGDWEKAMRVTGTFGRLFDNFLTYFANRRTKFMDEMEKLIISTKQTALSQKRSKGVPQSHGGVANLLKLLTQTMKAQDSSIKTIAKVQYAVCMQAGILIPDEFITDVLVAANIEQED